MVVVVVAGRTRGGEKSLRGWSATHVFALCPSRSKGGGTTTKKFEWLTSFRQRDVCVALLLVRDPACLLIVPSPILSLTT